MKVAARRWLWFGADLVSGSLLGLALVYVTALVFVQVGTLFPASTEDGGDPRVGDAAADFTLKDLDGREFRLKDSLGHQPIVLEFVSIT
jgi:hypothetical protein